MAKRTLVTADAVFAAADSLVAQGKNPSLRAVRRELGGGSFGSIGPFLQSWRRARSEDAEDEDGGEPGPLPPGVASALDRLMAAARDVSESVQQASRSEAESASEAARWREEIKQLQSLAETQIGSLRAERDSLQAKLAAAEEELEDLREWRRRAVQHMKALSAKVGS